MSNALCTSTGAEPRSIKYNFRPGRLWNLKSKAGEIGKDVNLANEHTIIDHSNNFDPANPVERLWDGDISGEAAGSPGARDIGSFWVEYDLGKPFRLSLIRFFGNASGDWVSKHYTVNTRKSFSDQWSTLINRADCFTNQWLETRMDDSVRHIHLSVTGDTIGHL